MSSEVIKLEDLMNRVIGWAVGNAVTQYLDKLGPGELAQVINSQAMKLIQQSERSWTMTRWTTRPASGASTPW